MTTTPDNGSPRKRWEQLDAVMQWSWERPDGGDRENPAQLAKDRGQAVPKTLQIWDKSDAAFTRLLAQQAA